MALAGSRWAAASLVDLTPRCLSMGRLGRLGATVKRGMPKGIILRFQMDLK